MLLLGTTTTTAFLSQFRKESYCFLRNQHGRSLHPPPFKGLFLKDPSQTKEKALGTTTYIVSPSTTPRGEEDQFDKYLIPQNDIDKHITMGLTHDQAQSRLDTYGPNSLTPPPKQSLWDLWLEQFQDRLVQILLVVALISTLLSISELMDKVSVPELLSNDGASSCGSGTLVWTRETFLELLPDFVEPFIILLILFMNAAIGVSQQLSAIASIDALEELQPRLATVLRGGGGGGNTFSGDKDYDQDKSQWFVGFDASTLVPGDIIRVKVGDIIPADAKLLHLESSMMTIDESNLTGESNSVDKIPCELKTLTADERHVNLAGRSISQQEDVLFSSTIVTSGSGTALVIRTGMNTEIGQIQTSVMSVEDKKTPLREKLDNFGDDLSALIAFIW